MNALLGCSSTRRFQKPFAIRVFANGSQNLPHGALDAGNVDRPTASHIESCESVDRRLRVNGVGYCNR